MSSSGDQDSQATQTKYRTAPEPTPNMPRGIPFIIGNEAAERFSFYGMKAILAIFMTKYLMFLEGSVPGSEISDAAARANVGLFVSAVYFFPILGALIADIFFGKYRTIIALSIVYCFGHAALALMGSSGDPADWLLWGLVLIAVGSGGIKPCVSAHVGDQFGKTNAHLLEKVFGWFYFSINFGSTFSMLLTPWLLEWYGPHVAFGIPGVLMAIATLAFWMGRKVFIHVPAGGTDFVREIFTRNGIAAILKLGIIYVFIAPFWSLFDQTASAWVLQAEDMDRRFLGINWLSSQIGAVNPILILIYIPLFQFAIYPAINRVFKLTPMRKISMGLFVMAAGFSISAVAQQLIDAGERPSIAWQLVAYVVITAAEVMVSITCLEFSYTQAPRKMKSVIMAAFLFSISLGNLFTTGVNSIIIAPSGLSAASDLVQPFAKEAKSSEDGKIDFVKLSDAAKKAGLQVDAKDDGGFLITLLLDDGGSESDAIVIEYSASGERKSVQTSENEIVFKALERIEKYWNDNQSLPQNKKGNELLAGLNDKWNHQVEFHLRNSKQFRIVSSGPDGGPLTADDINLAVTREVKTQAEKDLEKESESDLLGFLHPDKTWLDRRKEEIANADPSKASDADKNDDMQAAFSSKVIVGEGDKMAGASYYWFFTYVMLGTAILFIGVAYFYQPREYLQEEAPTEHA